MVFSYPSVYSDADDSSSLFRNCQDQLCLRDSGIVVWSLLSLLQFPKAKAVASKFFISSKTSPNGLKISIFDPVPFIFDLVTTGGDCMASASLAKANEKQPKRLPHNFARGDVGCSVRCPQRRTTKRMRWGQRPLQP